MVAPYNMFQSVMVLHKRTPSCWGKVQNVFCSCFEPDARRALCGCLIGTVFTLIGGALVASSKEDGACGGACVTGIVFIAVGIIGGISTCLIGAPLDSNRIVPGQWG